MTIKTRIFAVLAVLLATATAQAAETIMAGTYLNATPANPAALSLDRIGSATLFTLDDHAGCKLVVGTAVGELAGSIRIEPHSIVCDTPQGNYQTLVVDKVGVYQFKNGGRDLQKPFDFVVMHDIDFRM